MFSFRILYYFSLENIVWSVSNVEFIIKIKKCSGNGNEFWHYKLPNIRSILTLRWSMTGWNRWRSTRCVPVSIPLLVKSIICYRFQPNVTGSFWNEKRRNITRNSSEIKRSLRAHSPWPPKRCYRTFKKIK